MISLDHRLLRQFLTVADCGTLRAAARALNMSQPPLTAAIHQLEQRLGTRLFDRSVKGMRPTPAGEMLADEARAILARLQRAEARVVAAGGRARPLKIGFVSAALTAVIPSLLRSLKAKRRPAPQLHEMTTPEQLDSLEAGTIDLGLLHPPTRALPDLTSLTIARDPFWAALPSDHRLAERASLRFAEIASEPFILFPERQGPVLHERIRSLVAEAGGDLHVAAEARRVHSQLSIVSGGLGVGLITQSTACALSFRGVATVPLEDTADRLFLELHLVAEPALVEEMSKMLGADGNGR